MGEVEKQGSETLAFRLPKSEATAFKDAAAELGQKPSELCVALARRYMAGDDEVLHFAVTTKGDGPSQAEYEALQECVNKLTSWAADAKKEAARFLVDLPPFPTI